MTAITVLNETTAITVLNETTAITILNENTLLIQIIAGTALPLPIAAALVAAAEPGATNPFATMADVDAAIAAHAADHDAHAAA